MRTKQSNVFVFDEILLGGAAVAAGRAIAKKLRERHRKQLETALAYVDRALDRHERHLSGDEATTDRSQQKLMDDLEKAHDALVDALASEKRAKKR